MEDINSTFGIHRLGGLEPIMNKYERIVVYFLIAFSIGLSFQNDKEIGEVQLNLMNHEAIHPLFSQISENKCQRCGSNFFVAGIIRSINKAWFYCGDCGYRLCNMELWEFHSVQPRNKIFLKATKK